MLKQETRDLIQSFKFWEGYDHRTRKQRASHLRWCRRYFGMEISRQRQRELLLCRYTKLNNQLIHAGLIG